MGSLENITRPSLEQVSPGKSSTVSKGGITSYKPSEFARTRLLQELELVFKEFCKAKEIESSRDSIPYAKLQHHDPEKWKKKFKMLFEREKIVSFGKQGCIVDFRRIKFTPCQQDGPLP